jgi:hypothetical protein
MILSLLSGFNLGRTTLITTKAITAKNRIINKGIMIFLKPPLDFRLAATGWLKFSLSELSLGDSFFKLKFGGGTIVESGG